MGRAHIGQGALHLADSLLWVPHIWTHPLLWVPHIWPYPLLWVPHIWPHPLPRVARQSLAAKCGISLIADC